ncbi:MAG: tetratricopeptide repeat protein [Bacteroidaceae bacterium]|nr:tetratricopeptide repeat protein [Bacteroidaceae bacterium]
MMKRIIVLLMSALPLMPIAAQTENENNAIKECQRLYADGKYATALTVVKSIDFSKLDATTLQEAELTKALIMFENNHLEGRSLILQYLADYPETAKKELLGCHIAESYYYSGNYKLACEWFEKSNIKRLAHEQRNRAKLYYALSLLECNNEENATNMLREIAVSSKVYAPDALFHIAVTDYDNNKLEDAEECFKSIQKGEKYYFDKEYYIAGIALKRGETERAKEIALNFMNENGDDPNCIRMQQILGAAEYATENYPEAIIALKDYINNSKEPQRIAFYQLGMSLFKTGKYSEAEEMLNRCFEQDDAITQSALLHTGIIKLKNNDKNGARVAFEQAATMVHDDATREEALYNYAISLHQTGYSPFAESVKVFEQFLNDYPTSEHTPQVEKYLVEVYMNTRNYDIALNSIEKIKKPSNEILEAKQKILYRMGVQKFIDGDMNGTIDYMNRSIELQKYNKETYSDALFWKGEALYRKGEYNAAAKHYNTVLTVGGKNRNKAVYGIAYTLFQQKKYGEARREFEHFENTATEESKETFADVYNRIADCYFYQRAYDSANIYYKKAIESGNADCDYSLYRSALAQGLSKDYAGKVATLQELIKGYPKSIYSEQAYYEMGRAYIEQELYKEAVESYDRLMARFPKSSLTRRATTEKAMIYNTMGESEKAIEAYKDIIERYPHSEEAQIAFQDLKNIYVEMGQVNKFAHYAENATGVQSVNSNEIDTLTFTAAEKFFAKGAPNEAIMLFKDYLEKFPEGSFKLDSHYYLGVLYYNNKGTGDALTHFEEVIAYPDNKYSEEAMNCAATIYYNRTDYAKASELYKMLLAKTNNEERRQTARIAIMRSAVKRERAGEIVKYAGELLDNSITAPEVKREARYNRAKSYLSLKRVDQALTDLQVLAEDTRTKEGAEAKYLKAQILFDKEKYDDCEKEIMSYIEESTPHAYWLARSFVLLADLYAAQGRDMEAKQYLLSLQHSYSGDDDIATMIEERLNNLTAKVTE